MQFPALSMLQIDNGVKGERPGMKEMAMYEFEAADQPVYEDQQNIISEVPQSGRQYTAIVLAGSRSKNDPVASAFGAQYKALVQICEKPMIARVVEALSQSYSVKRVVIVFDDADELYEACPDFCHNSGVPVDVVPCGTSICSSVESAMESTGDKWPFLVTTADHALLTPSMVDLFCTDANDKGNLAVGFVEKKHIDAAHPGSKRTYLPFKETQLSGANLFAFTNAGALPVLDFWRQIEMKRKKPWQLFKAFGYRNLLGLLFKRYTVDQAFQRASKVLGVEACAIKLPFAEAAIDVDTPKDYHQVTQILNEREAALEQFGETLQTAS